MIVQIVRNRFKCVMHFHHQDGPRKTDVGYVNDALCLTDFLLHVSGHNSVRAEATDGGEVVEA